MSKRMKREAVTPARRRLRFAARAFFMTAALGVLVYGIADLWHYTVRSDLFFVQQVRVRGNYLLTEAEILRELDIPARVAIWRVQPERLEARLLALSLVHAAVVRRVLPHTLIVDVAERNPIMDWTDPRMGKTYALDEEGVVLVESRELLDRLSSNKGQTTRASTRPRLEGLEAWGRLPGDRLEAAGLGQILSAFGLALSREEEWVRAVESLEWRDDGSRWVFRCRERTGEIRLGDAHFLEKMGLIGPVWRLLVKENMDVAYMDLRFREQGVLIQPVNYDPIRWMETAARYPQPGKARRGAV